LSASCVDSGGAAAVDSFVVHVSVVVVVVVVVVFVVFVVVVVDASDGMDSDWIVVYGDGNILHDN
jgi:hypothetical protein